RCRFQVVVRGAAVVALGPQVGDRAQVDQRLVELCVVAAPAGGAGNARGMVAVEAGRARDLRQQLRARLHRAFAGAQALRLGDRDLGIVGPRQLVGLHQVFGERRRAGQGEGEGKNQGAAEHRESLAYGGLTDQNRNSGGGAAPNRYGSSVSNNDSMRWSSTSLCSSTASIAGTRPRTTNIRPPGRSQPLKRDGMASTAPVTQIASKLRPGSQANTSPTTTSTFARPCACRRPCAASARSAWRSMLTTSRASSARHAVR